MGQNWAHSYSTGSRFQNMGPSSKFPYLGMKLAIWRTVSVPAVSSFYYTVGVINRSAGNGFWDKSRFSNLPYLGIMPGIWINFQKLHMDSLYYYPKGYVCVCGGGGGRGGLRYGLISKFPYLEIKTSNLKKKLQKLHMCLLFTSGGRNWAYFTVRAEVSQTEQFWALISLINLIN